uniref:DRBM domain-containing protein n=2 Tax=Populus trichocarpa TaxID=3694 RepID=A0A3N7G625_POPTR|eukprot:XP_024444518.1 double-stranded RNA-binding protein 1 [Populus trichocarpa]
MDNPTESELSNPASPSPAPLALAPPPCTTPDLAPHPVTSPDPTPSQAPVPDPTPSPAPVHEPTPSPAPVPDPTPSPAPVHEPTPSPAPVPDPTPNPAPENISFSKKLVKKGLPDNLMYKNRLQEYTQKSSLQLPVYQTLNEGPAHMPRFRSTVWVDGARYRSQKTFLHRKAAEQDVANLALESILKRVKDEGCPLLLGVCEQIDTVFCKSILNEFAVKVNREKPTYNTVQSPGLLPVFISTLVFDGVSYTGDAGRNKKEAEQLAARAVILSLIGNSGSSKILYEIIKSKSKLYAALDRVKDPSHSQPNIVPVAVKVGHCSETTVDQEQEVSTAVVRDAAPVSANIVPVAVKVGHCSETTVDQEQEVSTAVVRDAVPVSAIPPAASGMHPSHHDSKRPRPDLHPVSEQPLVVDFGSSSAKKRRKNKKKDNKETDTQFPTDAIPLNQASPCSVAQ